MPADSHASAVSALPGRQLRDGVTDVCIGKPRNAAEAAQEHHGRRDGPRACAQFEFRVEGLGFGH
jgi:hypothetical protein